MNDDNTKIDGSEDLDDLEAQLAALGIGGDGADDMGDDMFAGFNMPSGDGDDDDPFAALAGFGAPTEAPATPDTVKPVTLDDLDGLDGLDGLGDLGGFGDSAEETQAFMGNPDDDDFDLDSLLNLDAAAGQNFEIKDVSAASPVQTVYDPEVDGMGAVTYVKGVFRHEEVKTKLFENISRGKMVATAVIGVILIAVGAVTAIFTHAAIQDQNRYVDAVSHFTYINFPEQPANNANFAFINERASMGERDFTLARISAAYTGTFFYFNEHFDIDDYYILLYNQARHLYSFGTFGMAADNGTVLRFGPLSSNTLFLTLHIQCRATDEYVRFNYRLGAPVVHEVPVFINRPASVGVGDGLVIRYSVFDSGSSQINFSYAPATADEGLRRTTDILADAPFVAMRDGHSAIAPLTNTDAMVYFERFGMYLGTAVFGPLFNLESTATVTFNNLTYFFAEPYVGVTPEELFRNSPNSPIRVPVGDFAIHMKGMDQQDGGRVVVLPLYGLDERNRRRAVDIDITLRIDLGDRYIDISGDVRRLPPYGADVLFNLTPHIPFIQDVDIAYYSLIIDRVEFEMPAVTVPVGVSQFYNMKSVRRFAAESAVYEAFAGLLAYRSGEVSLDGIVGLSPQILADVPHYFAPRVFDGNAMHSAVVSVGDLITVYDYIAVVDVLWTAGGYGAGMEYFRESFKVTAHSRDSIWSVTEIERIA